MSKKSRKRNKKILAVLGLAAAATAASKRKRNAAIDTGIASAEADKDSAMLADSKKKSTPIAPIGPRSVNVATPPKRSNASIAGDFITKVINPKKMEYGMQMSNDLVSSKLPGKIRTPIKADNSGIIKQYKSGGRATYKSGGAAKRGISPILMKGKR